MTHMVKTSFSVQLVNKTTSEIIYRTKVQKSTLRSVLQASLRFHIDRVLDITERADCFDNYRLIINLNHDQSEFSLPF